MSTPYENEWATKMWMVTMSTDPFIAPGNILRFETSPMKVINHTTGVEWGSAFSYDSPNDTANDVKHVDIDGKQGYFVIGRTLRPEGTHHQVKCTFAHPATTGGSCWTANDG